MRGLARVAPALVALGCVETASGLDPEERAVLVGRVTDEVGLTQVVAAYAMADGAALDLVELSEGATYALLVPADTAALVLAMDNSGLAVGAAVVPTTGPTAATTAVAPIDVETTVEALVLQQMLEDGNGWDAVDLRTRIDAETAKDALRAATNGADAIRVLAEAAALTRETTQLAWTTDGVPLGDEVLASVLEADRAFTALLHDGMAKEDAEDVLLADLRQARAEAGVPLVAQAHAEAMASVTWRRVIAERLLDGAEAATLASARLESRVHRAALDQVAEAGEPQVRADAAALGDDLVDHVDRVLTSLQAARAYEHFEHGLGAEVLAPRVQGDALARTSTAADVLDASLVDVVAHAVAEDDAARVPVEVVSTWTSWRAQVEELVGEGSVEAGLAVLAGGSFRATPAR